MKVFRKIADCARAGRRARTAVSLGDAVEIAPRYGLQGEVWDACTKYGCTPREALEDYDIVDPCESDVQICERARRG